MKKDGSVFIKRIKVIDDIIKVYYSDNTAVQVPYSFENYQGLIIKRKETINNFNIEGIIDEISHNNLRRAIIIVFGLIFNVALTPTFFSLVIPILVLILNELYQKDLQGTKQDYLRSKADLDIYDDIQIVSLKDMKSKNNIKTEKNELEVTNELVVEDSIEFEKSKIKVYKHVKK